MTITEPLRVVEDEWPELARKLPPKAPSDDQRGKGHQLRKTRPMVGGPGSRYRGYVGRVRPQQGDSISLRKGEGANQGWEISTPINDGF
jgi:hypothetical protein